MNDMEYLDYSAYQGQAEGSGDAIILQEQHYSHAMNGHVPTQSRAPLFHPPMPPQMSHDAKPRLTKEQADMLETHYRKQNKPSTLTKRHFAETLNVTLDKVNNWFQNRRAKSKAEVKKAEEEAALRQSISQTQLRLESESPTFPPPHSYPSMMPSEEYNSNALGISDMPQIPEQTHGLPFTNSHAQLPTLDFDHGSTTNASEFSDLSRLTMTQEQFDMMSRNFAVSNAGGQFQNFDMSYPTDQDTFNPVFSDMDPKQDGVAFGYPVVAQPLSSNDSSVPSVFSEQSMQFPNANAMQQQATMSAAGSDWAESRSSSLASSQHSIMGGPVLSVQTQSSDSQWAPGKSVPVDVDAMKNEFQQAAAQANQAHASIEQSQTQDQQLAYAQDDGFGRRGSSASMIQSMGNIGLHTPQPNQSNGVFKAPLPPANIAARRQRPRPANLSLRGQSFGAPGQPASPGYQHQHTAPPHQVRRAISNNVINGGVAQGRIQKSTPGSAQRSPMHWNFKDALNSPHLVRTMSHGNLTPITPMTPSHPNQAQQVPGWPAVSQGAYATMNGYEGQVGEGISYQSSVGVPPHVSPPHTPHWSQQPYAPYRIGSNVTMENTPPQSAPASQQCFPSNVFGPPPPPNPHMAIANSQQQQYLNLAVPDQQFQISNVTFAPSQHANVVSSGPAPGAPLTFAEGVPSFNAAGNMQMKFTSPTPLMQPTPQHMPYAFMNDDSPNMMSAAHVPKLPTQPANDFVVHEYSPPDSIKRSATPRKPVESGPKSWTFAHSRPTDFEEKKAKQEASSSPASSLDTASTS